MNHWGDQICNDCGRLIEEDEWCLPSEKATNVPGFVCQNCFDEYVRIISGGSNVPQH